MARVTLKSLSAENEALRSENAELRARLEARSTKRGAHSEFRRNAATLVVDGTPRVTYFTHSAAYKKMCEVRASGHRAMYIPVQ